MEAVSWGEFLATPPNMQFISSSTLNDLNLSSLEPPAEVSIDCPEISEIFQESQPKPAGFQTPYDPYSTSSAYSCFTLAPTADFGEIENRKLLIANLSAQFISDLKKVLSKYGEISEISASKSAASPAFVEFYDLRAAHTAKMMLNGTIFQGNTLSLSYAPLEKISDPKNPPNNGTIVIFHLPSSTSNEQIMSIFGQFGEVRQIRGTPSKLTQRFVEYWDTRAAAEALSKMNGNYVFGSRVSIEFSLPGGFRKYIQKAEAPITVSIQKPIHF